MNPRRRRLCRGANASKRKKSPGVSDLRGRWGARAMRMHPLADKELRRPGPPEASRIVPMDAHTHGVECGDLYFDRGLSRLRRLARWVGPAIALIADILNSL